MKIQNSEFFKKIKTNPLLMYYRIAVIIFLSLLVSNARAQEVQTPDSSLSKLLQSPEKYVDAVASKIDNYYSRINAKTEKTLERLSHWEEKIKSLLEKASPETAAKLFAKDQITFKVLLEKYKEGKLAVESQKTKYNEYREKLNNTLKYVDTRKQELDKKILKPLEEANAKAKQLEDKIKNTEALEQLIKERRKQLLDQAMKYIGKSKYFQKMSKETYYYLETIKNYKEIFSNPTKAEEVALKLLKRIPSFNEFLERNSFLSSAFGNPGAVNPNGTVGLLQSRVAVQGVAQQQLSASGPNPQQVFQQALQSARGQINELKQKISEFGGNSSDFDIPDFKPNPQKSKTLLQKIEFSGNIQTTKNNSAFPVSSDFGFSVGYKPSPKTVFGIGGSYKLGWGDSFDNIRLTHQGVSLRTFIDWRLKRSFFISGGYEQNYFTEIKNFSQLRDYSSWKSSALLGLSKKYKISKKKNGELKILYDFFSQTKIPKTSPVLFRVGFGL
ncbi:MAG TPA: hypothetical protein PKA77_14220 [Chitinophagaceae bacterium]|nr:hypothetical protein [Chitinophagaceae bacterium]HMU58646.1 hypothetical protein [Chitinophagaceae bacterium]